MLSAGPIGMLHVTAANPEDRAALADVLDRSARTDHALTWGGSGQIEGWAARTRVLRVEAVVVGVTLFRSSPESPAASIRVALAPEARDAAGAAAEALLTDALVQGSHLGTATLQLFAPAGATWVGDPAKRQGFTKVRSIYRMLRPAVAGDPPALDPAAGLRIRELGPGEDEAALQALNRAWRGTWNYHPIMADALARDLDGQRDGFLLAVPQNDPSRIVGTTHAIFDAQGKNPDGGPRAWISNVTTDPDYRGRGIARKLLTAGLRSLRARGAGSIGLGVDAGNEAPLRLYKSLGFDVSDVLDVWERAVEGSAH